MDDFHIYPRSAVADTAAGRRRNNLASNEKRLS
jgi:hypothetical protein